MTQRLSSVDSFFNERGVLVKEQVESKQLLYFLYATRCGRLVRFFLKRKWVAILYAWYQTSWLSKKAIVPFIKKHEIVIQDFVEPAGGYASFNDFFCRALKPDARLIDQRTETLVSPVDGKLIVFPDVSQRLLFFVKHEHFDLVAFLGDESRAADYVNGSMLLFRLAPYDYHRIHVPCDARAGRPMVLGATYESVNPIAYATGVQPLATNLRHVITLETSEFGEVIMVFVGAMLVGSIIETYWPDALLKKGEELGMFQFGGSSVVMLLKRDAIKLTEKIIQHSLQGYETAVKMGQVVGYRSDVL